MMRHLRRFSLVMTAAGIATAVAALALDLQPMFSLTGILLAWAGLVKVMVVYLWTRLAGLGSDRHDPIPPA